MGSYGEFLLSFLVAGSGTYISLGKAIDEVHEILSHKDDMKHVDFLFSRFCWLEVSVVVNGHEYKRSICSRYSQSDYLDTGGDRIEYDVGGWDKWSFGFHDAFFSVERIRVGYLRRIWLG